MKSSEIHNENKIIVLIGVSASGKSYYAHNYVKQHPNTIIVSRDSLRMQLFGYSESNLCNYYLNPKEKIKQFESIVTKFQDDLIYSAIERNFDVIIDNTHLTEDYIKHYKNFGSIIQLEVIGKNIAEDILCYRNFMRTKRVSEDIIKKQLHEFKKILESKIFDEIKEFNEELEDILKTCSYKKIEGYDCYVFDIDNTLAHKGNRSPYDYSKVSEDKSDKSVIDVLNGLKESGNSIIIVSGRDYICSKETMKWLEDNEIVYDDIYMRAEGDRRKDWIVKAEILREIQKEFNVVGIFDDRRQVVNFNRKLGFKVFQVENGNF